MISACDLLGYIRRLFEPGDWIDLQFIHQTETYINKYGKVLAKISNRFMFVNDVNESTFEYIRSMQDRGWNSYVGMNAFTPGLTRRRKIDVKNVRSVFAEFDENGRAGLDKIAKDVEAGFIPTPTFILRSSPGKYYVIWLIQDTTVQQQEGINKALQVRYGSDAASVDAARVLRLPGTRNLKPAYSPTPIVEIIEEALESIPRYTPTDFRVPYTVKLRVEHKVDPEVQQQRAAHYEQACENANVDAGEYSEKEIDGALAYRYEVTCPNAQEHSNGNDGDASIVIYASGRISFGCFHGHCKEKDLGWTNFYRPWMEARAREVGYKSFLKFGDSSEIPAKDERGPDASGAPKPEGAPGSTRSVAAGRRLNIQKGDAVATKKLKWLWPNRVPMGKLTIFAGVPGGGKTLMAGDIAARVSTGTDFFDGANTIPASEVLMLVGEDDVADTTIPRLMAAGADLTKINFLKSVFTSEGTAEERELQFDTDMKQVEVFLQDNPNVRLMVVDPVSNYLGEAKMNADQEIRKMVLTPLKILAEKMNVAVVGIMHLNKKSDEAAINRIGGAMAFVGVARAVYLFQSIEPEGEDNDTLTKQHAMVLLKCNISKAAPGLVYEIAARPVMIEGSDEYMPLIKFIRTTDKDADELLRRKSEVQGRPPVNRAAAKRWLREFLSAGPKPANEVLKAGNEQENFSEATVKRAKADLNIESKKQGNTWMWSLKSENSRAQDTDDFQDDFQQAA
jgi:putative DNA primase/helicase